MDGTIALAAQRAALLERTTLRFGVVAGSGFLVSAATVAVAGAGGFTQQVTLPAPWSFWPTGSASSEGWLALELLLVALLCLLWFTLCRAFLALPTADRPTTPWLAGVAAVWSLPFVVGGPLGSLDVFSYAAVGRLAELGLNPYHVGPGILSDAYAAAVSPMWRTTPTPYGPLQVSLLRLPAALAGTDAGAAMLLVRFLAVAGLAGAVAVTLRAVRDRDRTVVLLLTALNPVVLVTIVSGAHLDVLVGALAVLVVLLVRSQRPAWAMVAAIAACFIKLPGVVLVGYVLLDALRRSPAPARRRALVGALAAAAATTGAIWLLVPDAFGWVGALGVPGTTREGMAPSTWVSYLLAAVTGSFSEPALSWAFTVGRIIAAVAGSAAAGLLLLRATGRGTTKDAYAGVGWALIVVAVSGPTTYPWYLAWGLFAVAIGSDARGRRAIALLSVALCVVGVFSGGLLTVGALCLVIAGVWTLIRRRRPELLAIPLD